MKHLWKVLVAVVVLLIVGAGVLILLFWNAMKPDKEQEQIAVQQGEDYVAEHLNEDFEVFGALFDNMGNFNFDYAAKVRNTKTNVEFFVFENADGELVDTYVSEVWQRELEHAITPFVADSFGEDTKVNAYIGSETIGVELGIDPLNVPSYVGFDLEPSIRLTIPRAKDSNDEARLHALMQTLKDQAVLQDGMLLVDHINEKGEILDDEWYLEF